MKKIKKTLALSLALAMGLSLAACGKDDDDKKDETTTAAPTTTTEADTKDATSEDDTTTEATTGDVVEEGVIAAPSTDGWDESKKIYVYSWDANFGKTVDLLLEDYPEYRDYVDTSMNLGVGGGDAKYAQAVDDNLANGEKYPSIIPADIGIAKYWSEDDTKTANLYDYGFTDDMFDNCYDFYLQYAKYDGELKAVTYQANPGSVFYRRDIAKTVFGSDDPATVQEKLKDWDTFFATAKELKDAGYAIVSGPDDIQYAVWDGKKNPWVTDDKLTIEDSVTQYIEYAKRLYDEGLTNGTVGMWNDAWYADMKSDSKVFCYFGCPWFVGTMQSNGATDGDWGAVVGPKAYHWGGTFVCMGKDTPNPELAAWILYMIGCDTDFAVKLVNSDCDTNCSANKVANERLLNGELSDDFAVTKFLGGQNPFEIWVDAANGLSLDKETYVDQFIQTYMNTASHNLNDPENTAITSVDDAIAYIKEMAKTEQHLSE